MSLFKADFYRIKKDKIILIGLIISVAFTIMNAVSYLVMNYIVNSGLLPGMEQFAGLFDQTGETFYLSSFTITNNFGLFVIILSPILIGKEFSYGTIRNKVTCRVNKKKIYISLLLNSLLFATIMVLFNSLFSLIFGSIVFGLESFTILKLFKLLGLLLLVVIIDATIVSFSVLITFMSKSTIIGIIISLVFSIMVGSLFLLFQQSTGIIGEILSFIPFVQLAHIMQLNVNFLTCVKIVLSNLVFITILLFIGMNYFDKSEIK